jgi:hypothetical protein
MKTKNTMYPWQGNRWKEEIKKKENECGWFTRSQPYLSPQMPPDTKINRTGEVIAPCGEVTQPSGQVTLPHWENAVVRQKTRKWKTKENFPKPTRMNVKANQANIPHYRLFVCLFVVQVGMQPCGYGPMRKQKKRKKSEWAAAQLARRSKE